MNKLASIFRFLVRIFLKILLVWVLFVLIDIALVVFSPSFSGNELIIGSLVTGFVPFLDKNISEISWNAATWGPGLGAFVIATFFAHRYLSRWAKRTGRNWSFVTSFCLVMIVPVLFVISLIVPGVLLQWEVLRETVWIDIR